MRRRARVDANQPGLVALARAMGCSVQHLHMVGGGCPDVMLGYRGRNVLAEIKDGSLMPSARRLTDDEVAWHREWRGQVAVVETRAQLVALINGIKEATNG